MKNITQALLCLGLTVVASTAWAIDSVGIGVGYGKPNDLIGGRLAAQWNWNVRWFESKSWYVTGYWDVSAAYWHTEGDEHGKYKSIGALAAAPVFRFIHATPYANTLQPYLEASVGASVLSNDHLGQRDLGSRFNFQDLLGFGVLFGNKQQYDLSYHFLHYSNASIAPPNQGIDVKSFVSFKYRMI